MISKVTKAIFSALLVFVFFAAGCQQKATEMKTSTTASEPSITHAVAVLHPTEGNNVNGVVNFYKQGDSIKVVADVYALTPGKHGFHIHQYGDCTASDGTSAGGHFNPDSAKHGAPADMERHVGDLGNITADDSGHAHFVWTDGMIKFSGANSIIGRGVIVHGGADDLTSQPSGNAGPRVACGVVGIAKPENMQ